MERRKVRLLTKQKQKQQQQCGSAVHVGTVAAGLCAQNDQVDWHGATKLQAKEGGR